MDVLWREVSSKKRNQNNPENSTFRKQLEITEQIPASSSATTGKPVPTIISLEVLEEELDRVSTLE
jgi:hypothetical protein